MLTGLLAAHAAALRSAAGAAVATCATVAAASVGLAVAAAAIGLAVAATAVGLAVAAAAHAAAAGGAASGAASILPVLPRRPWCTDLPHGQLANEQQRVRHGSAGNPEQAEPDCRPHHSSQPGPYPELRQRHGVGRSASRLLHSIGDHHSSGVGGTDHSGRQHAALEVWGQSTVRRRWNQLRISIVRLLARVLADRAAAAADAAASHATAAVAAAARTTPAVAAAAVAAAAHAAAAVDPAGGAVRQPGRAPATAVAATAATAAAASHATAARGAAAVAASAHAAAAVAAAARDPRRARGV